MIFTFTYPKTKNLGVVIVRKNILDLLHSLNKYYEGSAALVSKSRALVCFELW